jgi:hypothetical protein
MAVVTLGTFGAEINLKIRQGCTFRRTFKYRLASGTAIDITGATIRAKIRKTRLSSTVTATLTCAVTSGAAGEFSVLLTDEQSAAITAGEKPTDPASKYQWDCEIEWPSGDVDPVAYGLVNVLSEVTK